MTRNTRQLFGGAFECTIPLGFVDASSFRQIPDNQEVFVNEASNDSIIIELVEQEAGRLDAAAGVHFQNLMFDNESINGKVISSQQLSECKMYLMGKQTIQKFNQDLNEITILMGVYRLEEYQTDVLITVNFEENPVESLFFTIMESIKLIDDSIFNA
jgi:hypothetical protein